MKVSAIVKIPNNNKPAFLNFIKLNDIGYRARFTCKKTRTSEFEVFIYCGSNMRGFILDGLEKLEA